MKYIVCLLITFAVILGGMSVGEAGECRNGRCGVGERQPVRKVTKAAVRPVRKVGRWVASRPVKRFFQNRKPVRRALGVPFRALGFRR